MTVPTITPPRASPFIAYNSTMLPRGQGFLGKGKHLKCIGGHRVSEQSRILEDGAVYCGARSAGGQAPCVAILYLLVFPMRGEGRRIYIADCTRDELKQLERLNLDPDGILEYFRATLDR